MLNLRILLLVMLPLIGCEGSDSNVANNLSPSMFNNQTLDSILEDYWTHLHNQENKELHNQLILISVQQKEVDTMLYIYSGKCPSRFIDSNYRWLTYGEYKKNVVLVGNHTSGSLGEKVLESKTLKEIDDLAEFCKYDTDDHIDPILFDQMFWEYQIMNDTLILRSKK